MSYRSALSNPVANSGDVGRIVYGLNLSNNIPLTTGVQQGIDTITLGEGLWNISCACNLELSASATITNSQHAHHALIY